MTHEREPRDYAKDMLRVYVTRGESVEQLAASQLGHYGPDYCAQIGGYAYHPVDDRGYPKVRLGRQEVAVTEIARRPCLHRYPLSALHEEILAEEAERKGGTPDSRPRQLRLF